MIRVAIIYKFLSRMDSTVGSPRDVLSRGWSFGFICLLVLNLPILPLFNLNSKLNCHSFRHAFATHLYESGTDLLTLKELLGHKSINSTVIYVHLTSYASRKIYSPFDQLNGGFTDDWQKNPADLAELLWNIPFLWVLSFWCAKESFLCHSEL